MTMPVIKAEPYHKIESFEVSLCLVRRDSRSSHKDPTHTAWILSEQKKKRPLTSALEYWTLIEKKVLFKMISIHCGVSVNFSIIGSLQDEALWSSLYIAVNSVLFSSVRFSHPGYV